MKWTVNKTEANKRLVNYLQGKLEGENSLRQIKKWMESNACCLNGQVERFASRKVNTGDIVSFDVKERKITTAETLYEDDYYRIVNKPAGILTENLQELLVHRLDMETSGILILPKSEEALEAMKILFKETKVQKHYWAIVDGIPLEKKGTIESKIGLKKENHWGEVPHGKIAITDWLLERPGKNCSLVSCYPRTGRTHQIRIHMHSMGNPILGDYFYCRHFKSVLRPQRQMLHARGIRFDHPFLKKRISLSAEAPEDFLQTLAKFSQC